MHQMQIDVKDRRAAARLRDQMRIPDLLEKCALCRHGFREPLVFHSVQTGASRQEGFGVGFALAYYTTLHTLVPRPSQVS